MSEVKLNILVITCPWAQQSLTPGITIYQKVKTKRFNRPDNFNVWAIEE